MDHHCLCEHAGSDIHVHTTNCMISTLFWILYVQVQKRHFLKEALSCKSLGVLNNQLPRPINYRACRMTGIQYVKHGVKPAWAGVTTRMCSLHHVHRATFAIWPCASWTNHVLMSWLRWVSKRLSSLAKTVKGSHSSSDIPASGSYTVPFVIVSRINGASLLRKSQITDHCGRHITPYLPNEMFSAKFTQYMSLKAYKKLYITSLWTYKPDM